MMFWGLVVGIVSFLLIGAFHVVVIRGEYRYGKGIWGSICSDAGR